MEFLLCKIKNITILICDLLAIGGVCYDCRCSNYVCVGSYVALRGVMWCDVMWCDVM